MVERFAHLVPPARRTRRRPGRGARHACGRAGHASSPSTATRRRSRPARRLGIETRVADLEGEAWPFAGETFDAIVVVLPARPRLDALLATLAPTRAAVRDVRDGNAAYGRPSNPSSAPARELLTRVRDRLAVVAFEQAACRWATASRSCSASPPWTRTPVAAGARAYAQAVRRGDAPVCG